ncbi:TetR family transcriptional regulator [Chimaeribacter coloradensis]|uniref:TetR family transcriptional regulator n=1 Tax=Chimaeribacter coloradensis TaxID=2060068 RepID=A0A2N5E5T1_9GAMM|nr:TetR/AcrR family transcriptional regulator [Chimaeribacter coloradensis]PLR36486.1 TetR family transcriptional regulator [Chimaeribacter coloradensis]
MPRSPKREKLLEATKELLWEVGFEAMSPRDIQERSAARPGSLYHHFASKLALAGEAMNEIAESDIARINAFFNQDGPPLEIVQRYLQLKRDSVRGCRFGRLVNEASIVHDELRDPVNAFFDAIQANLIRKLTQARDEGALPARVNPENLAISLLALMQGGAVLARAYQNEEMYLRAIDGAVSLLHESTS